MYNHLLSSSQNDTSFLHLRFGIIRVDLVFDPNKDIMLDMEIKVYRINRDNLDPVHLPNPTMTRRLMVTSTSISGMYIVTMSQGIATCM